MEPSRKRLAVIGLSHPFRGGISHFSTLLVRALRQVYQVEFLTLSRQYPGLLFPGKTQLDESDREIVEPNEPIIDSMNPLTWYRAAARLNQSEPDLIVIQWWHPFFAPAFGTIIRLLKRHLRRRVCYVCHNVLPHEGNPLQRIATRYAFLPAQSFVVHSEQDRRDLESLHSTATIRKGCLPTFADFGSEDPLTKRQARAALGAGPDTRTILFFGLVRRYKGLIHLIEAMEAVAANINCRLLVVGEFYDDKQPYLDLIAKLGLTDTITIVDEYVPNEEVAKYFSAADVVVLPYVSATQSGIVQIAFGLGTPVITTDVGGLPEAVDHGKTGLVVEAGKSSALADAILEYYSNNLEAAFREEIARQENRFDWQKEIREIEAFLDYAASGTDR